MKHHRGGGGIGARGWMQQTGQPGPHSSGPHRNPVSMNHRVRGRQQQPLRNDHLVVENRDTNKMGKEKNGRDGK